MQAETRTQDFLDRLMFLLHTSEKTSLAMCEYSESIFHYPVDTGDAVIMYTLFHCHVLMSKRFHHRCLQREHVVTGEEV